jgi:hypothetical protein
LYISGSQSVSSLNPENASFVPKIRLNKWNA